MANSERTDPLPAERIATAAFGATGHQSSRVIFGAAALGGMSQERADTLLPILLRHGINHLDTAASYGESELRLAPWMPQHRNDFFLATKTGDRSGADARASLERSLERLGTDHVDLIQLHNLVEEDEWQQAFAPDGAVAALFAARDEGLCRHVGVTGHGLRIARMHLRSLAEAPFASVLLPYSHVLDTIGPYADDVEELLATCAERNVAAQTIKSVARRRWVDGDLRKFSWYEPVDDPEVLARAVQWVLADQRVFLNTSSDARLLTAIIEAAATAPDAIDGRPAADRLEADRLAQSMTPLFDGGDLEVI